MRFTSSIIAGADIWNIIAAAVHLMTACKSELSAPQLGEVWHWFYFLWTDKAKYFFYWCRACQGSLFKYVFYFNHWLNPRRKVPKKGVEVRKFRQELWSKSGTNGPIDRGTPGLDKKLIVTMIGSVRQGAICSMSYCSMSKNSAGLNMANTSEKQP